MSDNSQGPGWWLASDGKWYPPPEPDPTLTAPIPPTTVKAAWWRRRVPLWALVAAAFAGLVVGAAAAGGPEGKDTTKVAAETNTTTRETTTTRRPTTTTTTTAPTTTTTTRPTTTTTAPPTNADEGWMVEQLNVEKEDYSGSFSATGRVRNTASASRSGIFTVTLFEAGGGIVGTLQGSADSVGAGQAATVQFISMDSYVAFDHWEFQTDGTYES